MEQHMEVSHCDFQDEFLQFQVIYGDIETDLYLPPYCTVGELKEEIYNKLEVPPMKQIIDCWCKPPEDDYDTLWKCCQSYLNYLVVYNSDFIEKTEESNKETIQENSNSLSELENAAALEFFEYFTNNFDDYGIVFHMCHLEDAISEACFSPLNSRKILVLYFHNKNDEFARIFGENLIKPEVKETLSHRFFLLGWNTEKEEYHPSLIEALSTRSELSNLTNFIKSKICAALLIVPIKNSFTLFSCMRSNVSEKDFLVTLKRAEEFFNVENEIEINMAEVEESSTDIGSTKYQQLMLDMLGDRDYDNFDHYEFDLLKKKIGYALYGPPQSEDGYDAKQKKRIDELFSVILKQNNIFTKWKDRIVISFIYNCTEPLPSEKQKRGKKYSDYNPNTDLNPIPIFILRKCKNSDNPCRIVIDDTGRVYQSWANYITNNKLPKCEMILPLNGRYQADEEGHVMLERHLSPACGIDAKILLGVDVASTAAGLVSGGVFIAAAIPTITVAPVALVAAGVTGLGVGLYSIGRSAYTLYDRSKHKETLSFANSESRGAYLNIVAGSLGFVGAGANMAVSQLAARGFNIGQGASAAVNVINVANISAGGISVVNSGYDVFDQWYNENQTPSLLSIIQLSSSILFFGHAVYNFRTAGTLIEESQAKTLRDYQDSLRSNRHRKTFNKMMKETIRQNGGDIQRGQAEVIKTVLSIQNKDEVFATLTRLNKRMNQENVKFSADAGEIKLNGVSVDMADFSRMDNGEVATFLSTLPNTPEPTQIEINRMNVRLQVPFKGVVNAVDILNLAKVLWRIFGNAEESVQEKMINAVAEVVKQLREDKSGYFSELDKMFPGVDKYMGLFRMVTNYFQNLVNRVEEQYQRWLATKDPDIEEPIFLTLALEYSKRALQIFDYVATEYYNSSNSLTETGLKLLLKYFLTWFTKQVLEYEERSERKRERIGHSGSPARREICLDCGGIYYH